MADESQESVLLTDERSDRRRRRLGALLVVAMVVIIGGVLFVRCGVSDESISAPPGPDGQLAGMVGVRARPVLPEWFTTAVNDHWIGLGNSPVTSFDFAAETFDAVIVAALAAEAAGSDGSALAERVIAVTGAGEPCTDVVQCMTLIREGAEIDFDGISGPLKMNGAGDVLESQYSIFTYGSDNRVDEEAAVVRISAPGPSLERAGTVSDGGRLGDGVLTIGGFLPETGALAGYGPSMFAAADYAISVINSAGGVLGLPVEYVALDSGDTSTSIPDTNIEALLARNVDVVIGAASSTVTQIVLERVIDAGVVMISPSNTSVRLTDIADQGLYFRISPPDDVQGSLLASLIVEAGYESVYLVVVDDIYGQSISATLVEGLDAAGIEVVGEYLYESVSTTLLADAEQIKATKPESVVLITYTEGANLLKAMVDVGIGPRVVPTFGVDGNTGDFFGENYDVLRSTDGN